MVGHGESEVRQLVHHGARLEQFAPAPLRDFDAVPQKLNVAVAKKGVNANGERVVIRIQATDDV